MKNFSHQTHSFSSSDRLLIAGSLLFSACFLVAWFNYRPNFLSRNLENIAVVEKSKEDVRWKIAGSFDWMRPKIGLGLIQGDQIFTGDASSATIKYLKKDIRINLKPNTLITIEEFGDKLVMDVQKGALDVEVSEKEEVLLRSSKGIEVISGDTKPIKIQVVSGTTNVIIPKKQDINLPGVVLPDFNQIYRIGESQPLQLTGKFDGSIEIAKNETFSDIVKTLNLAGASRLKSLDLEEEGEYFLRIKKADKVSSIVAFKVAGLSGVEVDYPNLANNDIVLERGQDLQLKWKAVKDFMDEVVINNAGVKVLTTKSESGVIGLRNPQAGNYTWQIKRTRKGKVYSESQIIPFRLSYKAPQWKEALKDRYEGELERVILKLSLMNKEIFDIKVLKLNLDEKGQVVSSEVVAQKNMDTEQIKLDSLAPGKYAVEATSRNYAFDIPLRHEFVVHYSPFKVLGISELNEQKVNRTREVDVLDPEGTFSIQLSDIRLALDKLKYNLKLNDIENTDLVTVKGNQLQVSIKDFGKYCFTAKVISPVDQQFFGDVSECFNVGQKKPFPQVAKAKDQVLNYDGKPGEERYVLYTPEYANAVEYRFFVYRDAKAQKLIFKGRSGTNQFSWVSNRSGIYFFRYQLVDKKGRESEMSPISRLVFPISPLSEW